MSQATLQGLLTTAVQTAGFELWGYEWLNGGNHRTLRVFIEDEANGITVDDCAKASEQITATLTVYDPQLADCALEVSSPGLDRPLYTLSQYERYVGSEIKLQLRAPDSKGQRRFRGVIRRIVEESIELETEQGSETIAFSSIDKARIVVDWEKSGAHK